MQTSQKIEFNFLPANAGKLGPGESCFSLTEANQVPATSRQNPQICSFSIPVKQNSIENVPAQGEAKAKNYHGKFFNTKRGLRQRVSNAPDYVQNVERLNEDELKEKRKAQNLQRVQERRKIAKEEQAKSQTRVRKSRASAKKKQASMQNVISNESVNTQETHEPPVKLPSLHTFLNPRPKRIPKRKEEDKYYYFYDEPQTKKMRVNPQEEKKEAEGFGARIGR